MFLSALVLACAMCADPDGTATAPPPVIAVHDVDEARATADCTVVSAIVGTLQCAILPPPAGLPAGGGSVIVSIYSDDPDQAEADAVAINAAYQGCAAISIRSRADAPPAPYAPLPSGRVHTA